MKYVIILLMIIGVAFYRYSGGSNTGRSESARKQKPRPLDEAELNQVLNDRLQKINRVSSADEKAMSDKLINIVKNIDQSKKCYSDEVALSNNELRLMSKSLISKLKAGEFEQVELKLQMILDNNTMNRNGVFVFVHVCSDLIAETTFLGILNKWCEKYPESTFAYTIRGGWNIKEAWRQRGSGWANSVTDAGWKGFAYYLALAAKDLDRAYQLNSDNYLAAAKMITVCMGAGSSYDVRVKWFERSVQANSINSSAYSNLLYSLRERWGGSDNVSLPFAIYLVQNAPHKSRVYLEYGDFLIGEFEDEVCNYNSESAKIVEALYQRYANEFSCSASALSKLAGLAWLQKRKNDAICLLDEGLKRDAACYVYAKRGKYHYKLDHDQKAYDDYNKAVQLNPHDYCSWKDLGRLNDLWKKDYVQAIKCYTKCLEYKPTYKVTRRRLGDCYRKTGEFELALKEYTRVLNQYPEYDWALLGRGTVYLQQGKHKLSEADFAKAVDVDSTMAHNVREMKAKYNN